MSVRYPDSYSKVQISDYPEVRRLVELVDELDDHYLTRAWQNAEEIVPQKNWAGEVHSWLLLPSRNTWPTRHKDRPAPGDGCGCAACHRPRCCGGWGEPVEISTGETVAWICPTCLEPIASTAVGAAVP